MRMRPIVLAGALAVVAAAIVVGGLLVLSDGGSEGDDAPAVPTEAVVGASTGVTATATPRPEALRELPPAVWTPIEAEDTEEAGDGNMFLLDLETGQLYRPTEDLLTWEKRVQAYISWADNGRVSVGMLGFEGVIEGKRASYIGEVLGPMRRLPGERNRVSSRGIVAYEEDGAYFLHDLTTNSLLGEVMAPDGSMGNWSADGRYLSFSVSPNTRLPLDPIISIWDVESGRVVVEVTGDGVVWAESGHRFLYGAIDPADPEKEVYEQRVHDIDSGTEQVIRGVLEISETSFWPSRRYVLIDATARDEEGTKHAFSVYDLEEQRNVITLRGAFVSGWLDEDTLAFTGDACSAHGYYTIDADGSNLKLHVQFERSAIAHPSRQGDRAAYSLFNENGGFVTTVIDLTTGEAHGYVTGDALLPHYVGQGSSYWSPDGRYLALIKPGGRDGICFSQEPQQLEIEVH